MNWDDPVERLALVERVGTDEYNRQMQEYQKTQIVEVTNGYAIRAVNGGRWGRLYQVDGPNVAFGTVLEARSHAESLPRGGVTVTLESRRG
jgi:hypothetical protein